MHRDNMRGMCMVFAPVVRVVCPAADGHIVVVAGGSVRVQLTTPLRRAQALRVGARGDTVAQRGRARGGCARWRRHPRRAAALAALRRPAEQGARGCRAVAGARAAEAGVALLQGLRAPAAARGAWWRVHARPALEAADAVRWLLARAAVPLAALRVAARILRRRALHGRGAGRPVAGRCLWSGGWRWTSRRCPDLRGAFSRQCSGRTHSR